MVKSFEEVQAELRTLAETDRDRYVELRRDAAWDLEQDWPEGEGMGSSDVSIHLIEMIRYGDLRL